MTKWKAAPPVVLFLTAFVCLLPAGVPAGAAGEATLFEGARLITGDGSVPIENAAILVLNGTIARVGRRGSFRAPQGATRVDLSGKTIIPALVTLHAHVGFLKGASVASENYTRDNIIDHLMRYSYYGIAAAMSTGTDAGDLAFEIRNGSHPGVLLRTAGRGLAMPNGATGSIAMRAAAYGVTTEEEARQDVRELAARQPDFIKIWVDDRNGTVKKLPPPIYRAIIDEAHRHKVRVMAHVFYLSDAHDLVDAGVDGFLHLVRDQEMDDDLVAKMKRRAVFVTPNLSTSERGASSRKPAWLDDPTLAETVPPETIKQVADTFRPRPAAAAAGSSTSYAKQQRSLAKLNAAGVPIALGNDAGIDGMFFGFSEHHELELMVAAGLTPMQTIVAATATPARLLRLDRLGTIAAGKSADFVVLDANPLEAIANTRRISRVYQQGRELDRQAMRARWTRGPTTP